VKFGPMSQLCSIEPEAFKHCGRLASISIPSSVRKLGSECFQCCTDLADVKHCGRPICESAFLACGSLGSIVIPSSVEILGDGCFRALEGSSLREVSFESPSRLRRIGGSAFWGCSRLRSLSLPSSVEFIGESCFRNCNSLSQLAILPSSRLHTLESLPPRLRHPFDVPDSVEIASGFGDYSDRRLVSLVLTFGRDSRLRRLPLKKRWHPRSFAHFSSRTLKLLRSEIEFAGALSQ
jgi:hypothetical protein